jgi:hypothetical protein
MTAYSMNAGQRTYKFPNKDFISKSAIMSKKTLPVLAGKTERGMAIHLDWKIATSILSFVYRAFETTFALA